MDSNGFATSHEEADTKYQTYYRSDPLQDIPPALLNSADIYEYVRTTGMIHPFEPNSDKLKSASYEIPFLGNVMYWEGGKKFPEEITLGKEFRLKKNSIAFVWPDTVFRLPDYIALRFNFRITHVHRGLLLGTGPLIDPGFVGRILIPIHNLTSEDYVLVGGEGLIWVEFTKLSPNKRWDNRSTRLEAHYREFPADKRNKEPHYYFEKASRNQPIQSSIPGEVKQAQDDAASAKTATEESRTYVKSIERKINWSVFIGVTALALTLSGIIYANFTLISNTNSRIDNIITRLSDLEVKSKLNSIAAEGEQKKKEAPPVGSKRKN